MASIIYKKLFEVRLLHDYFLATKDSSFFGPALSDQDRIDRLDEKYNFDIESVVKIRPTSGCIELMKNHKMRFIHTRYGFFVAQEVELDIQNNGDVLYKPILPLEDDFPMHFHLKSVDSYFQNYSGTPIKQKIPSLYYFDNKDDNNDKPFPALSLPVADFVPGTDYEMGELATIAGQLSIAKNPTSNNNQNNWLTAGGLGYVNTSDRSLLGAKFQIQLNPANLPVSITATLANSGGIVKTIAQDVLGNAIATLNFCKNPVDDCIETGWYDLVVQDENNVVVFEQHILINDDLYQHNGMGMLSIYQSTGTNYSLLDVNGHLFYRINANQTVSSHPIFELRYLSRLTYWRYKSAEPFTNLVIGTFNNVLMPINNNTVLVAEEPETLVKGINKQLDALSLPNPLPSGLRHEQNNILYSDVYISSINRIL